MVTDADDVTLVDTGYPGDRAMLVEGLRRIGRSPADVSAVVLTHGHPDHLGNAEYLRSTYDVPVWVHTDEAANARGQRIEQVGVGTLLRLAWRPDVLLWSLDAVRLKGLQVDRLAAAHTFTGDPLDVAGHPVPVPTPGHTSGHCAFHLPDRGVLLAGDALMTRHPVARGTGPRLLPDFFNVDTDQARESLDRIGGLPAAVVVPGHGPAFRGSPHQAVDLALAAS
jgi:glyoxylase-like metal-dependent hydrolase (beta-lactamase superfamily II)